ncbi:hypothetical protein NEF87_002113 [Candidatus Lokiarchaeum ossiferum]|uniref:Beta-propeller repeat protein n=1 Tax=Candidatus Lokiarchaeum ossiferum TaxID=2951803 RepID=A0ABY6HR61_9ARCH|nr:hypothetical protein NEF87_002113 [Candidatus Lokiarchaeum sp. B-35]
MKSTQHVKYIMVLFGILILSPLMIQASSGEELENPKNFTTFFGGAGNDFGRAITTDNNGNIIVVGHTTSTSISDTDPSIQDYSAGEDVIIAKFSPTGELIFYTYYGGSNQDNADGVAIDGDGNIIVTGYTSSLDFPTTNALFPNYTGGKFDLFILKLSSDGDKVIFSTYFGGTGDDGNYGHHGNGVIIDSNGNIVLSASTTSSDLLVKNPIQPNRTGLSDILILKLSNDGQDIVFATYFGGSRDDFAGNCVVNSQDQICFTGVTDSTDFPVVDGIQSTYGGKIDAFLTVIDSDQTEVVYSSYFGGAQMEYGSRIGIDGDNNLILTGSSASSDLEIQNAYQKTKSEGLDAYLVKISIKNPSITFSTYLGGDVHEWGFNMAVDQKNNIYLIGQTMSDNFPTKFAQQRTFGGDWDGFLAKFSPSGRLLSSSYIGGTQKEFGFDVTINRDDQLVFVFFAESPELDVKNAFQTENGGGSDIYLLQIKFSILWWIWIIIGVFFITIAFIIGRIMQKKYKSKSQKISIPSEVEIETK